MARILALLRLFPGRLDAHLSATTGYKYTVVVRLQRDDDERYRSPPARLAGKSSRAAPPADTANRSTKKPHRHAQALVTSGLTVSRAPVAKAATSALTSVAPAKYR